MAIFNSDIYSIKNSNFVITSLNNNYNNNENRL